MKQRPTPCQYLETTYPLFRLKVFRPLHVQLNAGQREETVPSSPRKCIVAGVNPKKHLGPVIGTSTNHGGAIHHPLVV